MTLFHETVVAEDPVLCRVTVKSYAMKSAELEAYQDHSICHYICTAFTNTRAKACAYLKADKPVEESVRDT